MPLGTGIAAFQLVPFGLRLRDLDLSYRTLETSTSIPPAGLLTTALPWALGAPSRLDSLTYFQGFSFLGAAAVVFAFIGLVRGPLPSVGRAVYWYCVVTLVALALPLYAGGTGDSLPLGGVVKAAFDRLPLWRQVPLDRPRALFLLVLTLVAGMGIEHVVAPRLDRAASRPGTAGALATASGSSSPWRSRWSSCGANGIS